MSLAPSTRLGPYEILAPLGAGGMGEVYRARDTRLGRDVALKILPADVANDPARRGRFELEARAVAALNHPNIVAVYDVGDGYIVSELVDGEPLRDAHFGLRKTLDIAVQIASGLAAAHEANITHRDLKPDNVLLTRDGRVKILDFGLAKVHTPRAVAANETLTVQTEPGVVMGTVGYMSPEQVRGIDVEHRSDIFSFGVILHELLGGHRPFQGETSVEVMTAILRHDAAELPETVPAGVRQIVGRCLEKEPANRFQSAKDLGFALSQGGTQTGAVRVVARRFVWPKWVASLALVAAGVAAGWLLFHGTEAQRWSAMTLGGPEIALQPRLSPDGHLLAFQAMVDGQTQVAVMKPESGNWSVLTHDRTRGIVQQISWSPDSSLIYYDRRADAPHGIFSVPALGGEERQVLESAWVPEALADGSLLVVKTNAGRRNQVFRFWPETGRLQDYAVETTGVYFFMLHAMPGGKEAILIGSPLGKASDGIQWLNVNLESGAVRKLDLPVAASAVRAWAVAQDGKSILAAIRAGALLRIVSIPIQASSGMRTLFTTTGDVNSLEPGPDGSLYVNLWDRQASLVRLSLNGEPSEKIAGFAQLADHDSVAILPDSRMVVPVHVSGRTRLMAAGQGKPPEPLINTAEETGAPFAVAGARQIAFTIGPAPSQTIAVADIASGRISGRLAPAKGPLDSLVSSLDGHSLYFSAGGQVWSVPSAGGEPKAIRAGDSVAMDPSGKSLVVGVWESAGARLFRVPLEGGAEREIVTDRSHPIYGIPFSPGVLNPDGLMLLSLTMRDSWFNPIGVLDTSTGKFARTIADKEADFHSMAWTRDGHIVALRLGYSFSMWKFRPESR